LFVIFVHPQPEIMKKYRAIKIFLKIVTPITMRPIVKQNLCHLMGLSEKHFKSTGYNER